jgi:hypothetical protein
MNVRWIFNMLPGIAQNINKEAILWRSLFSTLWHILRQVVTNAFEKRVISPWDTFQKTAIIIANAVRISDPTVRMYVQERRLYSSNKWISTVEKRIDCQVSDRGGGSYTDEHDEESSDASDLCSEFALFESRPGHREYQLPFIIVFHSSSLQMAGWYLKLGHNSLLPHKLFLGYLTTIFQYRGLQLLRREQREHLVSIHRENRATGKEGEVDHTRHKNSPVKRNAGIPVGYSEGIALRKEQRSTSNHC